ncbi:MAG: sigma-70 family RNA polymerase sigma factor [Bacteroidota bacterium]
MNDYNKYSDAELAGLFRTGDDAAFKEIYDRYNKLLYLFAYNKLREKEEAVDVVHDVFAWILNNRQKFALKSSLSSYLYKSVLNKIFDIFRHQAIIRKYVEQGDHFVDVDSQETDYLIREKDIMELIDQEIAAMPPKMREIYLLKYKQHLSPKEIALQLQVSESTVNTQVNRAVEHLKGKLGVIIYVIYILNR